MTVCLASINAENDLLVFGSDRMVTSSYPPIEFEHKISKIVHMTSYCVGLTAGDALKGKTLFDEAIRRIADLQPILSNIATTVKQVYQEMRIATAVDLILAPRGLTHKDFIERGVKIFPTQIFQLIDNALATYNFGIEVIIAGVDERGPHIYGLRNPGELNCYDSLGFHCIGSGAMHSSASLMGTYDPKSSAEWAAYSLLRAKREAEVAPGVGKLTDFGTVAKGEKVKFYDENTELLKRLSEIYEEERKSRGNLTDRSLSGIIDVMKREPEIASSGQSGASSVTKAEGQNGQ